MAAFFERDSAEASVFHPGDFCRGPWNRNSLHGRAVAALLAYGVEQHVPAEGGDEWHIARLTVDMFRLAPHAPTTLRTAVVRDGNRIRSIDATLVIEGVEVARASGLILRRSDVAPTSWVAPGAAREPVAPPEAGAPMEAGEGPFGDHRDGWEVRQVRPAEGGDASVAWLRMAHAFIEGEATSAFVRAAGAADFANPHSNRSEPRQAFINADMTLHLFRYPEGEWVGFEVAAHDSVGGVAIGSCVVRDLSGPIGRSTVATIANDRERARASTPTVRD
jgi:Thioesterase-like superfamily